MTAPQTTQTSVEQRHSRRRRLMVPAAFAALALGGVAALTSGALFTDTAQVDNNEFTAGTVNLTATPATAAFTVPNMAPGDVVTKPITVKNDGTLEMRYAMTSTATGGLAPALRMQVKSAVDDCSNTGFPATGTNLYGPGGVGTSSATSVFGNAQQGPDAGDRTLAPSAVDALCIQVTLPGSTGNEAAAKTANLTLGFAAEQTKNNNVSALVNITGLTGGLDMVQATDGNFYISTVQGTIIKATPQGTKSTLATLSGALNTIMQHSDGNFYTSPLASLTRVSPAGVVTPLDAIMGSYDLSEGPDGGIYSMGYDIKRTSTAGEEPSIYLSGEPQGALHGKPAWDEDGNLYFGVGGTITKVTPANERTVVGTVARNIRGMARGTDGNLYVVNDVADVYRVIPGGGSTKIATVAASGSFSVIHGANGSLFVLSGDQTGTLVEIPL